MRALGGKLLAGKLIKHLNKKKEQFRNCSWAFIILNAFVWLDGNNFAGQLIEEKTIRNMCKSRREKVIKTKCVRKSFA